MFCIYLKKFQNGIRITYFNKVFKHKYKVKLRYSFLDYG